MEKKTPSILAAVIVMVSYATWALADAPGDYKLLFGQEEQKALKGGAKGAAEFAAKLLTSAKTVPDQKELLALLCEKAHEFGMKDAAGAGQQTAVEAMKLLAESVPEKKAYAQEKLLDVAQTRFARSGGAARQDAGDELLDLLISFGDERTDAKDHKEAVAIYQKAGAIARSVRSARGDQIKDKIAQANLAMAARARFDRMKAGLEANPQNVTARMSLIVACLGELDDPAEAAKLLSDDLDEKLRTRVMLAARPLKELGEAAVLDLAGWYSELAENAPPASKGILLGRAKLCCRRYLKAHSGRDADRLKAQALLERVTPGAVVLYSHLPRKLTLDLGKGAILQAILIPAGKFWMGNAATEQARMAEEARRLFGKLPPTDDRSCGTESPQHEVIISQPFYMGIYEVTQEQYEAVTGSNPSENKAPGNPVEKVVYSGAVDFCKRLSARTGRKVRLPTEAEWEYACRAGTRTRFWFCDDADDLHKYANYADRSCKNGHSGKKDSRRSDGQARTAPVGSYKPNPWGLHDVYGNVHEWCSDWHGAYPGGQVTDPLGPASGSHRVIRGGSWFTPPLFCRSAFRGRLTVDGRFADIGLRVVVEAEYGQ